MDVAELKQTNVFITNLLQALMCVKYFYFMVTPRGHLSWFSFYFNIHRFCIRQNCTCFYILIKQKIKSYG